MQGKYYGLCIFNHGAAWEKFTEQLLHYMQEQTQISPLLQSSHLPHPPLHSPGKAHGCPSHAQFWDRQWDAHTEVTAGHH